MNCDETLVEELKAAVNAAAATLPPVAAEAGNRLAAALSAHRSAAAVPRANTFPGASESTVDVAVRDRLAAAYGRVARWLAGARRRPYELSLLVLAATTLAEAHDLERGVPTSQPCRPAFELVRTLLSEHRKDLRLGLRRLLEDVIDSVSLERGRGRFVRTVRKLLATADRWRPTLLDVAPDTTLRLGTAPVEYRISRALRNGEHGLAWAPLALGNAEGRLVVLVAAGRPPADVPAPTFSRAAAAVRVASHGAVELKRRSDGRPAFTPAVELTRRAQRAAATVRSLHVRPRRKRLQDAT